MILPQIIFWDWDKTIVDQQGLIEELKKRTLKKYTSDETYKKYETALVNNHGSSKDIFKEIFGDNLDVAIEYYYKQYEKIHIEKLILKNGIKEVLEFFHGKVPYMMVVSNKKGDYLRKEVTHLGFDKYFTVVIGAGDATKDKPHPEPVRYAIEKSQVPFDSAQKMGDKAWFVGDSIVDLQTAQNVDCRSVIINSDTQDFKNKGADYLFKSCLQFMKSCKEKTA